MEIEGKGRLAFFTLLSQANICASVTYARYLTNWEGISSVDFDLCAF